MKKTTWVIIGLSICVVVLSTALGVVLLQKKTETSIVREPDTYTSSYLNIKPWQFSLSPFRSNIYARYFNAEAYLKSHPENVLIVPRKGLTVYHNDKVTTYVIPGNKVGVIKPNK